MVPLTGLFSLQFLGVLLIVGEPSMPSWTLFYPTPCGLSVKVTFFWHDMWLNSPLQVDNPPRPHISVKEAFNDPNLMDEILSILDPISIQ